MAVTVQKVCDLAEKGTQKAAIVTIADTSYSTGGTAVAVPGFEKIKAVIGNYAGRPTQWDEANQKLLAYQDNATATAAALPEAAAASSLAASFFLVAGY